MEIKGKFRSYFDEKSINFGDMLNKDIEGMTDDSRIFILSFGKYLDNF